MSRKIDITITKAATFNTGNFSSVKPEVSLTLKDISPGDVLNEYSKLNELADALFALNVIDHLDELETYNQLGMRAYLGGLREQKEEMETIVRGYSEEEENE